MNQGLIPNRYAKALYEYAAESGSDKRVFDLMQKLAEAFASEPELTKAVSNPFVSRRDKIQLLDTASGVAAGDDVMERFMTLLADNNRLDMARDIALAYLKMYRLKHNIRLVTVTSAATMAPADEDRLKTYVVLQAAPRLGSDGVQTSHRPRPHRRVCSQHRQRKARRIRCQ